MNSTGDRKGTPWLIMDLSCGNHMQGGNTHELNEQAQGTAELIMDLSDGF